MKITSRDNSLLRHVRAVRDGKIEDLIFIEGLRLCEEARLSHLELEAVIVSEELLEKERAATVISAVSVPSNSKRLTNRGEWVSTESWELHPCFSFASCRHELHPPWPDMSRRSYRGEVVSVRIRSMT